MRAVAMACATEALVGYETAYKVLFKKKPIQSLATQHVAAWARKNGIRLAQVDGPAMTAEEALARAERMLAGPRGD